MKARMLILFSGLLITFLSVSVSSYSVDPSVNAKLAPGADGKSVNLSTSIRIPSAHSTAGSSGSNPKSVGPLVWRAEVARIGLEDSRGWITYVSRVACNPNTFVPVDRMRALLGQQSGSGVIYLGRMTNRTTGAVVRSTYYCKGPRVATTAFPRGVAVPPTYEQIWQAMYNQAFINSASSSGAYVAPASPGLTGLPTKIWSQFDGGQRIIRDVTFPGGYRLQASAYISEVTLSVVSGSSVKTLASLRPEANGIIRGGSFENPHAQYVFRRVGDYVIRSGIIWTANNATLTGPNIAPISVPVGSVRLEINREYRVGELKPAITK